MDSKPPFLFTLISGNVNPGDVKLHVKLHVTQGTERRDSQGAPWKGPNTDVYEVKTRECAKA